MNPFLHGRKIVGDWQGSQNLFGPLSCKLVKLHDGAGRSHGSQKQLFLNSFAHSGLCPVPQENDYPLAHSVQSLMVTLVIRFAASRSHMAFRVERSCRMALMVLGLPRCTLAVSQPIA